MQEKDEIMYGEKDVIDAGIPSPRTPYIKDAR
jgi:hypothetical protein